MHANEIRALTKSFLEKKYDDDSEDDLETDGMKLLIQLLTELAAHSSTIASALSGGNLEVKVREGSHGH